MQFTVLAYSATLVTYLIDIGLSLQVITVAKASGSIMSIGSTFLTPVAVSYSEKRRQRRGLVMREQSEASGADSPENLNRGMAVQLVGRWAILGKFLALV